MKIFKIQVNNFRLLKDFSIDIEDELSLVIGKNNTGKTSLLSVLDKFLNHPEKFSYDDFNIEFKQKLLTIIESEEIIKEENFKPFGIKLKIFIKYGKDDNLSNISKVMMDLDPDNNVIVLGFEYALHFSNYEKIKKDYLDFQNKEKLKATSNNNYKAKGTNDFLKENLKYFNYKKYSYGFNKGIEQTNESIFIDLENEKISTKEIINFKFISARREVTNKEVDKTLSNQTSRIYERTEANEAQISAIENFKDRLCTTDSSLSDIYSELFKDVVKKVELFGGIKHNESEIQIISTLQHRELLKGNTTVVYKHDTENNLPEYYNGLGYMNLISMIFEIEILVQEFKAEKEKKPSDINLLFIEEPEAHTHPQMQYVFIKNIKQLLKDGIKREDSENRELQYIISTHSSHIVADCVFCDIKYLKKEDNNSVSAKNLKDLQKEYEENSNQYQFLTQYLTISRAEIFFADKVILIEGDTERLLLPTMMRKIDIEARQKSENLGSSDSYLPLLSQNISIIEVGAYSHIFEKFIDFLGIKSLIITDLDSVDNDGKKCRVKDGTCYSNTSLSYFFKKITLSELKNYKLEKKLFSKIGGKWVNNNNGNLCIVYQINENGYHPRSFEDAFIHINRSFIVSKIDNFKGLQKKAYFNNDEKDAYFLADECIIKKTHFAIDILYNSDDNLSNWQIPDYIKEGFLWLQAD